MWARSIVVAAVVLCAACGGAEDDGWEVVTVQVYDTSGGVLVVGAPVVFHRADGSTLRVVSTDAEGRAAGTLEPGGAVTAVAPIEGTFPVLFSALGLQGGETLVLGNWVPSANRPVLGRLEVSAPAVAIEADAPAYSAFSDAGCGGAGSATQLEEVPLTFNLALDTRCSPSIDVLTTVRRADGVTEYAYTTGVAFTPGATVDQGAWLRDFDVTQVTLTNFPGGLRYVNLTTEERRRGLRFTTGQVGVLVENAATVGTSQRWTKGFATGTTLIVEANGNWNYYSNPVPPATMVVDLIDDVLPTLTSTAFPPTQQIPFTRSGGTAAADLMGVMVQWDGGGWFIFAPPDSEQVSLPILPSEVTGGGPGESGRIETARGYLIASSDWEGYRDALESGIDLYRPGQVRDAFSEGLFQTSEGYVQSPEQ